MMPSPLNTVIQMLLLEDSIFLSLPAKTKSMATINDIYMFKNKINAFQFHKLQFHP